VIFNILISRINTGIAFLFIFVLTLTETMDWNLLALPLLTFVLKLSCFIIGYFIIRMGYNLIVRGIQGEFKFSSEFKGLKGGLISSSPGLLFVLLGTCLIAFAMFVNKPFNYSNGSTRLRYEGSPLLKNDSIIIPTDTNTIINK